MKRTSNKQLITKFSFSYKLMRDCKKIWKFQFIWINKDAYTFETLNLIWAKIKKSGIT